MAESVYERYADLIWRNHPFVRADHIRWHTSGYHIRERSITVETAVEDAYGCLDIDPREVGIDMDIEEWQENWMEKPEMIAAMARCVYRHTKQYGRYAFENEPDWLAAARRFLDGQ